MWKSKKLWAVAVGVLLCLCLSSCKGEADLGPATYEVEGSNIPSLNELLKGEGGILESAELPEPPEEGEAGGEPPQDNSTQDIYIYHYRELPSGGQTVQAYVDLLTQPELGFLIVNAAGRQVSPPDFTAASGALVLSRNESEDTALRMILSWEENACTVKVALTATRVQDSTAPEATSTASTGQEPPAVTTTPAFTPSGGPLSAEEAVAFLESRLPSLLGVSNTDNYNVYFLDGKVNVNGAPCHRLRVYVVSEPEGSNAIVGTYLLARDGSHLYQLDMATNQVTELSF